MGCCNKWVDTHPPADELFSYFSNERSSVDSCVTQRVTWIYTVFTTCSSGLSKILGWNIPYLGRPLWNWGGPLGLANMKRAQFATFMDSKVICVCPRHPYSVYRTYLHRWGEIELFSGLYRQNIQGKISKSWEYDRFPLSTTLRCVSNTVRSLLAPVIHWMWIQC